MFNTTGLLEAIFVLVSSPALGDRMNVFIALQNLFTHLMDSQQGLLYLSSKVEVVNGLIRVFIQNSVCISLCCLSLYCIPGLSSLGFICVNLLWVLSAKISFDLV